MPKKTRHQLQYTKTALTTTLQQPQQLLQQDISLLKLYDNIHKLTLNKFIDCNVNNNLQVLVISGAPTDIELFDCWQSLISQYTDAIGDNESRMYLNAIKVNL